MSEPGLPAASGLFDSAGRLLSSLLAVVQTRLELVSVDVSEAQQHLLRLIVASVAALFAVLIAVVLATLVLVMAYWDSQRLLVLGLLSLVYFGLGSGIALLAVREARRLPRAFASSIAELAKDRQQLRPPP